MTALKQDKEGNYNIICSNRQFTILKYDYTNPLGAGAFGKVYKAMYYDENKNQYLYACKVINKNCGVPVEQLKSELTIMLNFKPDKKDYNVVDSIGYTEDNEKLYILMEYYEYNLTKAISSKQFATEEIAMEYFRHICYGLKVLDNHSICHRDLKTDNIMIKANSDIGYTMPDGRKYDYYLAITDFGLSKRERNDNAQQTMAVGTPYTMAPEVATGNYDRECDLFSLGCVLFKILTGKEPFTGSNEEIIKNAKSKEILRFENKYQVTGSPLHNLTVKVLEGLLQYDKNERLSMHTSHADMAHANQGIMYQEGLNDLMRLNNFYGIPFQHLDLGDAINSNTIEINMRKFNRRYNGCRVVKRHQTVKKTLYNQPTNNKKKDRYSKDTTLQPQKNYTSKAIPSFTMVAKEKSSTGEMPSPVIKQQQYKMVDIGEKEGINQRKAFITTQINQFSSLQSFNKFIANEIKQFDHILHTTSAVIEHFHQNSFNFKVSTLKQLSPTTIYKSISETQKSMMPIPRAISSTSHFLNFSSTLKSTKRIDKVISCKIKAPSFNVVYNTNTKQAQESTVYRKSLIDNGISILNAQTKNIITYECKIDKHKNAQQRKPNENYTPSAKPLQPVTVNYRSSEWNKVSNQCGKFQSQDGAKLIKYQNKFELQHEQHIPKTQNQLPPIEHNKTKFTNNVSISKIKSSIELMKAVSPNLKLLSSVTLTMITKARNTHNLTRGVYNQRIKKKHCVAKYKEATTSQSNNYVTSQITICSIGEGSYNEICKKQKPKAKNTKKDLERLSSIPEIASIITYPYKGIADIINSTDEETADNDNAHEEIANNVNNAHEEIANNDNNAHEEIADNDNSTDPQYVSFP